jgi:RND superfamily putative drug exporter
VVVLLAFLLLMTVFRSLLIPLTASVMNLLSVGAALGALNAVFNLGWGSSIFGLSGTGPIDAFIPVLLFSVLFGLSMDYEVYLVSRIQEEWHHLHHTQTSELAALGGRAARRNHQAVTTGQAKSGQIIAAAASIMILVFGSFLLGGQRVLQEFGSGSAKGGPACSTRSSGTCGRRRCGRPIPASSTITIRWSWPGCSAAARCHPRTVSGSRCAASR